LYGRPDDNKASPSIDEVDISSILTAVAAKKYTVILSAIVAMIIAAFFVSTIAPVYRSTATLLIEKDQKKVVSIEQVYNLDDTGKDYIVTQIELLRSRSLVERVVKELDLMNNPDFNSYLKKPEKSAMGDFLSKFKSYFVGAKKKPVRLSDEKLLVAVVNKVRGMVGVSQLGKTRIVKVSVEFTDPVVATDIANLLASGYIESNMESRVSMNRVASKWINSQLSVLKGKLEESEIQLQKYREQENLVDLNGISTISGDELSVLSLRQIDARRERVSAEGKYLQVKRIKSNDWKEYLDLPSILSDKLVGNLKLESGTAKIKYDSLAERYGSKHPRLISARSEYESALHNLKEQVLLLVSGISKDYQLAVAAEKYIDDLIKENNERIQDIKRKEFKFMEYQREVDTNLALYDTFLTRLKETKVTSDLEEVNARIVDKAIVPSVPFKPKKLLLVVLAGIGFSALVSVILVLIELNRNVLKKPEDVESKLSVPLIGSVPKLELKNENLEIGSTYFANENPLFSEAIRTIRTSLLLSDMENENKIILMTSSVAKEGKTSISSNLALSLGKMEKVILVCADMRKQVAPLNGESSFGLSDLIQDRSKLSDTIITHSGIDIILPGDVPANPLELISTERFSRILDYLRSQYDRIIIDSAPVELVSDSLVLSKYADSVIYLSKADDTVVPLIRRGIGRLIANNASILGVVLNQVSVKTIGGIGYGKSRGYYGYGEY